MAAASEANRMQGECTKWMKGYGFIKGTDGRDYFVHQTKIKKNGFRSLAVGESVEFDSVETPQGRLQAENVTGPGGVDVQGQSREQVFGAADNGGFGGGGGYGQQQGGY